MGGLLVAALLVGLTARSYAPPDGPAGLQMPPAKPIPSDEDLREQLPITVYATADGEIDRIEIGSRRISGKQPPQELLAALDGVLRETLVRADVRGVEIQVSPNLLYERLMQVVDVCIQQTLKSGERLTEVAIHEIAREDE